MLTAIEKKNRSPAKDVGNHDQGRPAAPFRATSPQQDRRIWSVSFRDVFNLAYDADTSKSKQLGENFAPRPNLLGVLSEASGM